MTWKTFAFNDLSLQQFHDIMQVRQEVFVVEQNCPYLDADGKDQDCFHIVGVDNDNEIVAYARIVPFGISYKDAVSLGRILTTKKVRGKSIGKQLVAFSIVETNRLFPNQKLTISAQSYLIKFYENFGFNVVGEPYLEDDIPHIKMILK